jgi:hypothetical protein
MANPEELTGRAPRRVGGPGVIPVYRTYNSAVKDEVKDTSFAKLS